MSNLEQDNQFLKIRKVIPAEKDLGNKDFYLCTSVSIYAFNDFPTHPTYIKPPICW